MIMKFIDEVKTRITLSEINFLLIFSIAVHLPQIANGGQRVFTGASFWLIHLPVIPILLYFWYNKSKNE